nr:hypothetical protein [uncultured Sphingorhabdus sp.]
MQPQTENPKGVRDELIADAKSVGTSAVNRLHSEVDARKGDAVSQVHVVSSTIEKAANQLEPDAPAWLKSALEQGAQQIQKLADTLEQNDSRQMVEQVNQFARNSPATFLATCAAAGFAMARVFKAGASEQSTNTDLTQDLSASDWDTPATNTAGFSTAAYDGEVT